MQRCSHQQANNATRIQVHYTKYLTDSVSILQQVIIAREKWAWSRSLPCKQQDAEIQGDIDGYVVKMSVTFKSDMDIEIV